LYLFAIYLQSVINNWPSGMHNLCIIRAKTALSNYCSLTEA